MIIVKWFELLFYPAQYVARVLATRMLQMLNCYWIIGGV